jgi:hypothetical protein
MGAASLIKSGLVLFMAAFSRLVGSTPRDTIIGAAPRVADDSLYRVPVFNSWIKDAIDFPSMTHCRS